MEFREIAGKTCITIEPWSLNHTHGLLQLHDYVMETNGQGQRTNAITEWAHCQRQVAFLYIGFAWALRGSVPCHCLMLVHIYRLKLFASGGDGG